MVLSQVKYMEGHMIKQLEK